MSKGLTVAAGFAISLSFITSSATADPYKWCAAYGTPGGTNCGFLTIEQCRATHVRRSSIPIIVMVCENHDTRSSKQRGRPLVRRASR